MNDHHVARCLETLFATTRDAPFGLRVTLTDNSPGTGIGRRLAARFPHMALIENAERRGYGANHNAALRADDADYVAVANDDLEFVAGGLDRAIAFLEEPGSARVGCVGLQLLNPDGSLQPSTYSFPTIPRVLLDVTELRRLLPFGRLAAVAARLAGRGNGRSRFWAHDRTVDVESFRAAIMIARRRAVDEIGWLDETTLIGAEDTEWHRRFHDAGWRVVFLHDAPITHHGSQTVSVNPEFRAEFLKGQLNYFRRHRSGWPYRTLRAVLLPLTALRWAVTRAVPDRRARRVADDLLRVAWRWRP